MAKDTIKDIWNEKQGYYYVYKQHCYWDVEKKQVFKGSDKVVTYTRG